MTLIMDAYKKVVGTVDGQNLGCSLSGLWESDTVKGQNQTPEVQHRQSNAKGTAINKKYILKVKQKGKTGWSGGQNIVGGNSIRNIKSTHFHSHSRILLIPTLDTDSGWSSGGRLDFKEQIKESINVFRSSLGCSCFCSL